MLVGSKNYIQFHSIFQKQPLRVFTKKETELYQKRDAGTSDIYVLNLECPCTLLLFCIYFFHTWNKIIENLKHCEIKRSWAYGKGTLVRNGLGEHTPSFVYACVCSEGEGREGVGSDIFLYRIAKQTASRFML